MHTRNGRSLVAKERKCFVFSELEKFFLQFVTEAYEGDVASQLACFGMSKIP